MKYPATKKSISSEKKSAPGEKKIKDPKIMPGDSRLI